jgi:hypothetical protein
MKFNNTTLVGIRGILGKNRAGKSKVVHVRAGSIDRAEKGNGGIAPGRNHQN